MKKTLWNKGDSINELVHSFTVGNDHVIDLEIAEFDIVGSFAHAKMLAKIGILTEAELKDLASELSKLYKKAKNREFTILKEQEDCHTAIEAYLTDRLEEAGKKIHTGRSRNDQVLLAVRLYMRNAIVQVLENLVALNETFLSRITELKDVPLPGYTHMQKAMPSSITMWLHSFSEWCLELIECGLNLYDEINVNPLGAASGFGVPLNLDRDYVTELLNFKKTQRSVINVQNSRGRFELKALRYFEDCFHLIEKLSSDLILYSMDEFSFIMLNEEFTTGSSIMPQKKNPDVLELLRGSAAKVRGASNELQNVISKLPSNYHRDFQYTKEPLIKGVNCTKEALLILNEVVKTFSVNKEKLKEAMTDELYATYDTYNRVKDGAPFREAYLETAKLIKTYKLKVDKLKDEFKVIEDRAYLEIESAKLEFISLKDNILKIKEENLSITDIFKD